MKKRDEVVRCLSVDLFFKDDDDFVRRRAIRDALTRYREACRRGCAALFACECAAAKIETLDNKVRISADSDKAKKILELMFGGAGKAYGYEMRPALKEILQGFRSDYCDFALRDISSKWRAKDAQFAKAGRNWLALNFSRRLVWFSGLPLPFRARNVKLAGHEVALDWSGEPDVARLCSMDPKKWREYIKIRDGEYRMGSCFLNERRRRGKLRLELRISYYKPLRVDAALDPEKILEVSMAEDPEEGFTLRVRDGRTILDRVRNRDLNVVATLAWLDRLAAQEDRLFQEFRSSGGARGNNHRAARISISRRRNALAQVRARGSRTWNHKWSITIRNVARGWKCGKVIFFRDASLFERPWQWDNFARCLRYKVEEIGARLSVSKVKSEDEVVNAISR